MRSPLRGLTSHHFHTDSSEQIYFRGWRHWYAVTPRQATRIHRVLITFYLFTIAAMLIVQARFGLSANLYFTLPALLVASPIVLRRMSAGLAQADIVVSLSQAEKLQQRSRRHGASTLTILTFVFAVLTLIGVHLLARGQVVLGALGILIFGAAMAVFAVRLLKLDQR